MKPAWYPRLMTRSEQIIEEEQDGREETMPKTYKMPDRVMSKHTPGPWDYVTAVTSIKHAHPGWTVRTEIGVEPRRNIARVGTTLNIEVGEANAALIAAAPEMLEALKLALRLIENMEGKIQKLDYITVTGELERAIAKAEGKNQK